MLIVKYISAEKESKIFKCREDVKAKQKKKKNDDGVDEEAEDAEDAVTSRSGSSSCQQTSMAEKATQEKTTFKDLVRG